MFLAVLVHLQEQLLYVWLLCGYIHPTARRISKCDVQRIKAAPEDGLIQPETCRGFNGK